MRRELGRAKRADDCCVRREEEERVGEVEPDGGGGRRVRARELDQRRGTGGVVVRPGARAAVVPVGHEDDRLLRQAGLRCDEVLELQPAATGDGCGERLGMHLEAVRLQLRREPAGGVRRPGRAGDAARVAAREVRRDRGRGRRVEGRRQIGRLQCRRTCDAERQHEQRQPDEQPRAAVEAPVDGPFERPATRAAPLRCRRDGSHGGSIVGREDRVGTTTWPIPPPSSWSTTRTPSRSC